MDDDDDKERESCMEAVQDDKNEAKTESIVKKFRKLKFTVKKKKKISLYKEEEKVRSLGGPSTDQCSKRKKKQEKVQTSEEEPDVCDQKTDDTEWEDDEAGLPVCRGNVAFKKNYKNQEDCIVDNPNANWPVNCSGSVNHNLEFDGYVKRERAKNVILRSRYVFESLSKKKKGPYRKATTFKNNNKRFRYIRERDKVTKKNPRFPPKVPFVVFTFADEVLEDLCRNFDPKNDAQLKHKERSAIIVLRPDKCGEHAMEELLSVDPALYNCKKRKNSTCAEPSPKEWLADNLKTPPMDCDCRRPGVFVADFSVIYPEDKISTVFVTCNQCGVFAETILSDRTSEMIKRDLKHNLAHWETKGPKSLKHDDAVGDEPSKQEVMVFEARDKYFMGKVPSGGVAFKEGIMGFTRCFGEPLKPSVYIRVRVTYYCNGRPEANVINSLHR